MGLVSFFDHFPAPLSTSLLQSTYTTHLTILFAMCFSYHYNTLSLDHRNHASDHTGATSHSGLTVQAAQDHLDAELLQAPSIWNESIQLARRRVFCNIGKRAAARGLLKVQFPLRIIRLPPPLQVDRDLVFAKCLDVVEGVSSSILQS